MFIVRKANQFSQWETKDFKEQVLSLPKKLKTKQNNKQDQKSFSLEEKHLKIDERAGHDGAGL